MDIQTAMAIQHYKNAVGLDCCVVRTALQEDVLAHVFRGHTVLFRGDSSEAVLRLV